MTPSSSTDAAGDKGQQAYLAERRPYRLRPGRVRAPKRHEAREPNWRPYERTDDLMERVKRANEEQRRHWDEERRRVAQEIADDPGGPFKVYNAAMRSLQSQAHTMSHREVKARMRDLGREQYVTLPEAYLELQSRLTKDENFYRRHPFHAVWWLLRYGRPGTFRRRWQELRTGRFHLAG